MHKKKPVEAYFVGPDDEETCPGCHAAVNGNPYTLENVPEPGSCGCGDKCRHMVQLRGDIPPGVKTYTLHAGISIE